jgi:hypothetical protein
MYCRVKTTTKYRCILTIIYKKKMSRIGPKNLSLMCSEKSGISHGECHWQAGLVLVPISIEVCR